MFRRVWTSIDNSKSNVSYFALEFKKSSILIKQEYHLIKEILNGFALIFYIIT